MEIVKNTKDMQALGQALGRHVQAGDVLLLKGDLGSGKTTLTQGIAKGLGIGAVVNSPTFVLINEYTDGRIPLYHMDLYRLQDPAELDDLGLEDYFFGQGVCVVEWPELAEPLLPESYAVLHIAKNGDYRELSLSDTGCAGHIKGAYDEYFGL
jgi:tRNA threonylcarbamoyladenosine biosynthesis protein TsaE